jgi:putative transcriptional regulator
MNEELRRKRKQKGYTVRAVAEKVGITAGYYSMIENGKRRVNYPLAFRIAKVFGTQPDSLFLEFQSTLSKPKEKTK